MTHDNATCIPASEHHHRRAWGNAADPLTPGKINRLRIESQGRTVPWTEAELAPFAGEPDAKNIR